MIKSNWAKYIIVVMLLICISLSGCSFEISDIDDSEERTYCGTVYDMAFSAEYKDGLRAKVYEYYLFSEAEQKVLKCVHGTAGAGRTRFFWGSFEGVLGEQVRVIFDSDSNCVIYTFDEYYLYEEDGNEKFSETPVKSAIQKIELWD